MTPYNYPSPRTTEYKKPTSIEDCLPQARLLAKKTVGRGALGPIKKGDKILIVTLADQDEYVKEAVTQALIEEGAEKVDFIFENELGEIEPRKFNVEEGWKEADSMENAPWDLSGAEFYSDIAKGLYNYVAKHAEYTGVFGGIARRSMVRLYMGENGHKFRNNWIFNNWEEFLSDANVYPDELWTEIERKIIEPIGNASSVRITDPEGTYLEYDVTAEQAKRWQMTAWLAGHLFLDPLQATTQEIARTVKINLSPKVSPVFHNLKGVLAGTSNHMGYIPRIKLYFDKSRLVEVDGGGKYGDLIREMMDKYKNVQWPGYPDKGFFWFCDAVVCTLVKAFRRKSDLFKSYWRLANVTERSRAGIFHLGFGSRQHGEEYLNYAKSNNLPTGHIHVHNYFATYEIKIRGTDYWYKIVDKGWVTAMDDPEIRALAVKYGEPEDLLSYDWVPPLPGINCAGDYLKDYAPDPIAYLKKRMSENQPI